MFNKILTKVGGILFLTVIPNIKISDTGLNVTDIEEKLIVQLKRDRHGRNITYISLY